MEYLFDKEKLKKLIEENSGDYVSVSVEYSHGENKQFIAKIIAKVIHVYSSENKALSLAPGGGELDGCPNPPGCPPNN